MQGHQPLIKDVRGKGLILGMELAIDGAEIVKKCMEKGLLIITSGAGNVLRFVPPLIITEKDVDQALDILEEVFRTA
jgi:4-aminobutyrate aminotransferase-like enzyme